MGITCWSMKRRINDYVDGRLRGSELTRFEGHLSECGECELRINEVRSVRSSLRGLPQPELPSDLRVRLRVKASKERLVLMQTNGSKILRLWNAWKFRLNEMMRPLTIPATGGFVSALALFGIFALTISTTTQIVSYDVPVIYADHINANLVPMELRTAEVVVTMSTDGAGRITDYAFREGSKSVAGDMAHLQPNNISLPDIPSVMTSQPVSSDISIRFTPIVFRP